MENLDRKITITKDGQNEIVDFAEPTFIPVYNSEYFRVEKFVTVTDDYDRRVDLISLAVYGSDDYVDIILKCNEISDNFRGIHLWTS